MIFTGTLIVFFYCGIFTATAEFNTITNKDDSKPFTSEVDKKMLRQVTSDEGCCGNANENSCDDGLQSFCKRKFLCNLACEGSWIIPSNPSNLDPLFRLWNGKNHFYCTSESEKDRAVSDFGYNFEGIAGYISKTSIEGTKPLYRSYNPGSGDHFYTTNENEKNNAVELGWTYEGIEAYVFEDETENKKPFYRLWNDLDHFYTTSIEERDNAILKYGYKDEGFEGYLDIVGDGTNETLWRVFG